MCSCFDIHAEKKKWIFTSFQGALKRFFNININVNEANSL
jgi:hypothetical protein